jgi:hypothetical protein
MADIKIVLAESGANPVSGDLYLENGTPRLTSGLQEDVAQDLRIALSLFQGEWFLDPTQGIPYFQTILGHRVSLNVLTQIFRKAILERPGIKSIQSINLKRLSNRKLQVNFAVVLADGTVLTSSSFEPFVVGA